MICLSSPFPGKGSVASFLAGILRSSGLAVATYTSPSLYSLTERISTTDVEKKQERRISDEQLEQLLRKHWENVRKQVKLESDEYGQSLSHFEVLTALAFRHMADQETEIAVVEAGLGGVTDATNVFSSENVAATCLSSVGFEHVDVLGGSLESIARAKSGIAKRGRPMLVGGRQIEYTPSVRAAISETCQKSNAPLYHAEELLEWTVDPLEESTTYIQKCSFTPLSTLLGEPLTNVSLRMMGMDLGTYIQKTLL